MRSKYTETFINNLHDGIKDSLYTYVPSAEDYRIIDEIVSKYYSYIFNRFYNQKNKNIKFIHNPELAHDFNITLINLIIESVRLLFFKDSPFTSLQKALFFESFMKTIDKEINKQEPQRLTNSEVIENIIEEINKEYIKFTNNDSENNTNYFLSKYQILREYINQKMKYIRNKRYHLFVYFEDDFRSFSNFIIIFSIAALFLAIYLPSENIYFQITNKILLIVIILISFVFPGLILHIQETFVKMKLFYNPYKYYERLGIDLIAIYVCESEIIYVDPEQKNLFIPYLTELRQKITDTYGFVLPDIRILDSTDLKTGYKIFLHGNEIMFLDISMEDLIVTEEKAKEYNIEINENYIKKETEFGIYYTINKQYIKEPDKNIYYTGIEYFQEIMKKITLKYINLILTINEALALFELYKSYCPLGGKILMKQTDIFEIKDILINLLQKHCSIKDIVYVMEKIIKYSKTSNDTDYIAFQIYDDMIKDKYIIEEI